MKKLHLIVTMAAVLLSACAPPAPTDPPPTATSAAYPVPADGNLYALAEGGFSIVIPAGWSVAGPITVNGYSLYRFGVDPSASGGPDSGQVIIADAASLTIEQFAQQMCSICPANPIEDATVGGLPAKRTLIGGGSAPASEWHFVTRNGKLIGLSFRPAGDAPTDWIIGTLRFDASPANY